MRPVFLAVGRLAGARDKMETAGLVRAFVAKRTHSANVASVEQPYTSQCEALVNKALDETVKNDLEGALLRERE
jgi:hypothetical protein